MNEKIVKSSKLMAYFLRHAPEVIGLNIDTEGWVAVQELADKSLGWKDTLSVETIMIVVSTDAKGRYELSEDSLRIRAMQGHSTDAVVMDIPVSTPPAFLLHGTADRFLHSILEHGLLKGSRHHVHLSADIETARSVGSRHGRPIIFSIRTADMLADGFQFHRANNGVWLVASVPVKYLTIV